MYQSWVQLNIAETLYNLVKSSPLKCKFLILSSSWVKIHQIPYVTLETANQFFFRFFIILQCHYLWLLCKFALFTLNKKIPWKYQFWHFQVFWWKFAKFVMSFSKLQVIFSLNFASLFGVIKHTPLYFFRSNVVYFAQKGPIKVQIF